MTFKPATPEQLAHFKEWFVASAANGQPVKLEVSPNNVWRVTGNMRLIRAPDQGIIPIKFESCTGTFIATLGLTSLENFPKRVEGSLLLFRNKLLSMQHAPNWVGGILDVSHNPLISLEGFPSHVGDFVVATYSGHLPLLRLLSAKQGVRFTGAHTPVKVIQILNDHKGEGKPGAIKAATELIKAGYPEHAKW